MYSTELRITLKQNNASLPQGDSGGGAVYNGMIYGVHTSGVEEPKECAPEGAFLNICRYKAWIQQKTGIQWTMSFNINVTVNKKTVEFL